jgi:DDE superfamily endonuclease
MRPEVQVLPGPQPALTSGDASQRCRGPLERAYTGPELLPGYRSSYNTDALIGVLDQLGTFYTGQRVVVIWDGLSSHWSTRMRAYLDSQRDWLRAERLPAYAPELNPVEYLWANLKDLELANLPGATLADVADAATQGIQRVCTSDDLVAGFLAHTGLALDDDPST